MIKTAEMKYFAPFLFTCVFTTVSFFFVKIISIPDEELFSGTYVGCTASYFVKMI